MADESPQPEKKPLFNLRHFVFQATKQAPGAIFGAISAGLLAILGWWLTSSAPHLSYTVTPPVSFAGEKVQFGIVSVSVVNDGSKEAEAVVCELDLTHCSIRDIRVGPAILDAAHKLDKGRATVTVKSLNPGETLQVTVETDDVNNLPDSPKVSVRGKNIVGELRLPKSSSDSLTYRIVSWVTLALVFLLNIFMALGNRRTRLIAKLSKTIDSQSETIDELATLMTKQKEAVDNSNVALKGTNETMLRQHQTIQDLQARLDKLTNTDNSGPTPTQ
jgi:hypothetical protein